MVLRLGYDNRTRQYFIQIQSNNKLSAVFTPTIDGIINLINIMKSYDKISIVFDNSLTVEQKQNIKVAINTGVQLP